MSLLIICVPLLPLLAAAVVAIGECSSQDWRVRAASLPMGLAFFGAAATLVFVSTEGPVTIRFSDQGNAHAVQFGFYFDRLSTIMMTLITAVGGLIYVYSKGHMYQ